MADLTMYDSVDVGQIPADAAAVAGYVGGRWPTFAKLDKGWPHAFRLSIAVRAEQDADCLDIEKRDATPDQAAAWVRRQQARGVKKPAVYASVSQMGAVLGVLESSGIPRRAVRVWTAHYNGYPHRCDGRCGYGFQTVADATQYTDKALGRNLDASLVSPAFFTPGVSAAVRRAALRAWVVARRTHGWSWARLKGTARWRLWRRLGGR